VTTYGEEDLHVGIAEAESVLVVPLDGESLLSTDEEGLEGRFMCLDRSTKGSHEQED
jgi:hypothetical protein